MKVSNPFSESGEQIDYYFVMDIKTGLTEDMYKKLALLYKYKVEKNQNKKEIMRQFIVERVGEDIFLILDKYLRLNDESITKLPVLIWFEENNHQLDFIEGLGRLGL